MQNKVRLFAVVSAGFIMVLTIFLAFTVFSSGNRLPATIANQPLLPGEDSVIIATDPYDLPPAEDETAEQTTVTNTINNNIGFFLSMVDEAAEPPPSGVVPITPPVIIPPPSAVTPPPVTVSPPAATTATDNQPATPTITVPLTQQPAVNPPASITRLPAATTNVTAENFVNRQAFWVQLVGYPSMIRAIEERDRLIEYGYLAIIQTARVHGQDFYRLHIGAWNDRRDAERFRDRIRTEGRYGDAFVVEAIMRRLAN